MNSTDARAIRSRQALLDAGLELLLKNPAASLSEIAAHAGVGRATLYRQFESREQLIQVLTLESLKIKEESLLPIKSQSLDAMLTLEAIFHAIMPLADKFHFLLSLWNIAEQDPEVMAIYNGQLYELVALVERGKKEGCISKQLDSNWLVCLIDSLIYSGWWMTTHMNMSSKMAADHAVRSLRCGIKPT